MQRKKKEKIIRVSKSRMPLDETLQILKPALKKLANPENLKPDDLQNPNARSLVIDGHQYIQGYGLGKTYYYTSHIRLSGNWLMEKGFVPGGKIRVLALEGLLVICPE